MYIFISHSTVNEVIAEDICNILENAGHRCFIAQRDIKKGYEYAAEIVEGIDDCDAMLLLLSKEAAESPHVLREIERAVSKKIPIIVYKLEEVQLTKSLEYFLMTHQWITNPKNDYEDILECIEIMMVGEKEDLGKTSDKKIVKRNVLPIVIGLSAVLIASSIIFGAMLISNARQEREDKKNQNEFETIIDNDEATSESLKDIKIGSSIIMGNYNSKDIEWRVLRISEDGKKATLISDKILTIKAFTAAESGKGGYYKGESQFSSDSPSVTDLDIQRIAWGDSTWKDSTLRMWLNSSEKKVEYVGKIPSANTFSDEFNDYGSEPGFLYGFSQDELNAIIETEVNTKGNDIYEGEIIQTKDKVYLLSVDELEWIKDTSISMYAVPTDEALANNNDPTYEEQVVSITDTYYWWLRDPVDGYSSKNWVVNYAGKMNLLDDIYYACVPSIGVRPVITVDLDKLK